MAGIKQVAQEKPAETRARRQAELDEQRHVAQLQRLQHQAQRREEAADRKAQLKDEVAEWKAKRKKQAADRKAARARNTPPLTERTYVGRPEHGGPLKFGDLALGVGIGAASGLWTATRSHSTGDDLYWATGSTLLGIIVAAAAREGTEVEYGSYAVAAVNGAYLLLRLTGGITTGG